MDRDTLTAMAERCELSDGPCRELDAAIWLACMPNTTRKELRYTHKPTGKECVIDETRENGRLIVVPEYTGSLDAALTLVGDYHWRVEDHPLAGPCAVVGDAEGYAPSPTLALISAALRNLAARTQEPTPC